MTVNLQAGELRHVIEIQQNRRTFDANGDPTRSWSTVATVRAMIMPIGGDEGDATGKYAGVNDVKMRMRFHSGLTPSQRIVHESKNFQIVSVSDVEGMGVAHEIVCREIVTGG